MEQEQYFNTLPGEEQRFLLFFNKLLEVPPRQDVLTESLQGILAIVCPALSVGKVDVVADMPPGFPQRTSQSGRKMLYSDGIVDVFHPISNTYRTENDGSVTFEFYRKGDQQITESDRFWINRISEVLFLFVSRAFVNSSLLYSMGIDHSTGLPNTGEYMRRMAQLIDSGEIMKFAAAYFNIRNFKYINKLVNHQGGDEVMYQYVSKVSAILDRGETLARLGGDNYVVLVRKENLKRFLEQMDAVTVDVATHSGVRTIAMPARIGVYEIDRPVLHPGEIMMATSVALQISREPGMPSHVFYNRDMSRDVLYEKKVALDFNRALEQGQFRAYFQPKVDLATGKLCGAEALARWENKGEVLLPNRFVPMLEKDGAVCRLDFEMLRQSCEMLATWTSKGLSPLPISVNMSRWHLRDKNFVQDVASILEAFGIEPRWIEIELTETVDYEEYQIMVRTLEDFQSRGFMTSIDDFGSGYSSLTMLHRTDVNVLKLDQSFLWEKSEKGKVLIRNVIRMAKELGIKVLAEGVETVDHRDFLIECGCDMAQGFLYAEPLKKEEFERRAYS